MIRKIQLHRPFRYSPRPKYLDVKNKSGGCASILISLIAVYLIVEKLL